MENSSGNGGETPRRVATLEAGLQRVQGRLDSLERSNRSIESDIRSMKDQINSMQSSIQDMLMIFRNLSQKILRQGQSREDEGASQGAGRRVPGAWAKISADELVRDPRHLREDKDEDA
jgi:DNA anti-recombination protein RmuC